MVASQNFRSVISGDEVTDEGQSVTTKSLMKVYGLKILPSVIVLRIHIYFRNVSTNTMVFIFLSVQFHFFVDHFFNTRLVFGPYLLLITGN